MDTEMIGQTLASRFRLEAKLGEGAMGQIFAARDLLLDREVAIKLAREELARSTEGMLQFMREAKIAAQLALNPHLLVVYDMGFTSDNLPFIVTERLRGRPLKAFMSDLRRPSRSWVIELGMQVAVGLIDLHHMGITHRDLKPGNIFVVETKAISLLAKLIDFGLSSSAQFSVGRTEKQSEGITGSLRYVAPEVLDGQDSTPSSDIYSFGLTLYELATAVYPYSASTVSEVIEAHRSAAPNPQPLEECGFPETFQSLAISMLAKNPRERPSADECLKGLRNANRALDKSKGYD